MAAWATLLGLTIVLPLGIALVAARLSGSSPVGPLVLVGAAVLPAVAIGVLALSRGSMTVHPEFVEVSAGLSTQRFLVSAIRADSLADVAQGDAGVGLRLAGVGLPGSLSGWFRNLAGGKMFLAMVGRGRAMQFTLTDGTVVRATPKSPEAAVAHLRGVLTRQERP